MQPSGALVGEAGNEGGEKALDSKRVEEIRTDRRDES